MNGAIAEPASFSFSRAGFFIAFVYDCPFAAISDALRWAVPPCFCLFIALDQSGQLAHQRASGRRSAHRQTDGAASTLESDESFIARSAGYGDFFYRDLGENPLGSGLGVAGRYQSYLDHRHAKYIDGAVIEIGTALGILGGACI